MKNTFQDTRARGNNVNEVFRESTEILSFNTGEHIFKQGDLNEGLYSVIAGKVKLYRKDNGRDFIFDYAAENELIGMGVRRDTNTYFSSAVAIEPVRVMRFENRRLSRVLRQNPNASLHYMKILSSRIRRIESKTADMVFEKSNVRLARYLVERFKDESSENMQNGVQIPLDEIVAGVNVSESYLVKLLALFKKKGLIKYRKDKIKINSFYGLVEEARLNSKAVEG